MYRKCLGDAEGNLGTLQMLTAIENKLEGLFETIEMMPPDKVEQAEKIKDKERRQRIREEKMEAQRILQEERVQRALERAKAPVKRKTGKPVVFRSAPPQRKIKKTEDTKKKEEGILMGVDKLMIYRGSRILLDLIHNLSTKIEIIHQMNQKM